MNRSIAMLIIGLVFGGGLGFVLAASTGVTLDGHDHSVDQSAESVEHSTLQAHDMPLRLPQVAAPKLEIEAFPDPVAGWNFNIRTTNFAFSPANAGLTHVGGEGHAHVFANGVKLVRVYGDWVHLDRLPEGAVEIEVTLNANDHRPLAVGDVPISAKTTIVVPSGG